MIENASDAPNPTGNTSQTVEKPDFSTSIPETLKKLELKAFRELLERQTKGEKLTASDLTLMKRLRTLYPEKEKAPDDEPLSELIAELASRPGISSEALRFKPVSEVARLIGCSDKNLKNYCSPSVGSGVMTLPHKRTGKHGAYLVQAAVAYEFILRFGQRAPRELRAPPGWVSASGKDDAPKPEPVSLQPATTEAALADPVASYEQALDQIQRAILNPDAEFDRMGGNERVRVMGGLLETLRRHKADLDKMNRRFNEDEVVAIVQWVGREWVRQFMNWTPGMAELLDKYLAEKFEITLSNHNSAARSMLQAQLQNHGDDMIKKFREHVDEKAKGVQYMKGTV